MRVEVLGGPQAGRTFELRPGETVIGRSVDADVTLDDALASSRHARLRRRDDEVTVEDLGSTNGTLLDGVRLEPHRPVPLRAGAQLSIGSSLLALGGAPAPPRLTVRAGADEGAVLELASEQRTVGRDDGNELVLRDPRVSGRHAGLRVLAGGRVEIADLGSSNGTLVDGHAIDEPTILAAGAQVQVGDTLLQLVGETGTSGAGRTPTVIGVVPRELLRSDLRRSRRGPAIAVAAGVLALLGIGAAVLAATRGGGTRTVVQTVPAPTQLTTRQIVAIGRRSAVSLLVLLDPARGSGASGSGEVVDAARGFVLTNNHVATGGQLKLFDADHLQVDQVADAMLVAAMPCEDLALVQVASPDVRRRFRSIAIGDSNRLQQGDPVIALGFPGSAESGGPDYHPDSLSATSGIVSKVHTQYDSPSDVPHLTSMIQHTAAINHGNSGGMLLDEKGRLVGVNTALFDVQGQRAEGENYAISSSRVREVLPALEAGQSKDWIGTALSPYRSSDGRHEGFAVDGVTPGSPAAKAGVQPGDVILQIDGEAPVVKLDATHSVPAMSRYCDLVQAAEGAGRTPRFSIGRPSTGDVKDVSIAPGNAAGAAS